MKPIEYKNFFSLNEGSNCTLVEVEGVVRRSILRYIADLPESIINKKEGGREKNPHVTVLYGIEDGQLDEVKQVFKKACKKEVITAKLGKISLFENDEFDVLKIDVHSEILNSLNEKLKKAVKWECSYSDYHPHLTLAYIKKGTGKKYVGDTIFKGKLIEFDAVQYSSKNWKYKKIDLFESFPCLSGQFSTPNMFGQSRNLPAGPDTPNTLSGFGFYDNIRDEDLNVPGINPDELRTGIWYERRKMNINPNIPDARNAAIANLTKNPSYYSELKMYDEKDTTEDETMNQMTSLTGREPMKYNAIELGKIIRQEIENRGQRGRQALSLNSESSTILNDDDSKRVKKLIQIARAHVLGRQLSFHDVAFLIDQIPEIKDYDGEVDAETFYNNTRSQH